MHKAQDVPAAPPSLQQFEEGARSCGRNTELTVHCGQPLPHRLSERVAERNISRLGQSKCVKEQQWIVSQELSVAFQLHLSAADRERVGEGPSKPHAPPAWLRFRLRSARQQRFAEKVQLMRVLVVIPHEFFRGQQIRAGLVTELASQSGLKVKPEMFRLTAR